MKSLFWNNVRIEIGDHRSSIDATSKAFKSWYLIPYPAFWKNWLYTHTCKCTCNYIYIYVHIHLHTSVFLSVKPHLCQNSKPLPVQGLPFPHLFSCQPFACRCHYQGQPATAAGLRIQAIVIPSWFYAKYQNWLVVSTPLKNMKVKWEYYSQYMEK